MKNNYESFINSYLEYIKYELNYSDTTVITYRNSLKEYGKFLNNNNYNFININIEDANKYKAYLISNNYENKTSSLYLSAVRNFYNYLVEIKALTSNPYLNIRNPKVEKKLPNFLNSEEINKMFDNINYSNDLEVRNILIQEFLYTTGLRVSELCNIKINPTDAN